MIVVVITIIGFILYKMNKEHTDNIKRINHLENKLNEYYKEREQTLKLRLKSKGLIND